MPSFIAFFQTVAAEVVAYYLCKWLDSLFLQGQQALMKRSTPVLVLPGCFDFLRGKHVRPYRVAYPYYTHFHAKVKRFLIHFSTMLRQNFLYFTRPLPLVYTES